MSSSAAELIRSYEVMGVKEGTKINGKIHESVDALSFHANFITNTCTCMFRVNFSFSASYYPPLHYNSKGYREFTYQLEEQFPRLAPLLCVCVCV